MKENKYDEPGFFEKYAQMSRSREGLAGAGEWKTLEGMLPALKGRRVLDLGCGYGWHCIYAAEHGAASVTGIDLSEKMLAVAREKTGDLGVTYLRTSIEDVDFPPESFDVVLSSLALHYVADLPGTVRQAAALLAPGGDLVFSMEHPVFTAQGPQDWYRDGDGRILHFPVDRYFSEGARRANFLGEEVVKYHRTLETVLSAVLDAGLVLCGVAEPRPPEEMLDLPGMRDELRRPMMLIVSAKKRA